MCLLALLVLFSILAPSFLTANNLAILSKHVAISAILAIGMTFVVLTGGIDLSVGSVAGLGGMVAGYLLTQGIVIAGVGPLSTCRTRHADHSLVCLIVGLAERLAGREGRCGTVYRDAGHALYRARRSPAALQWQDISQSCRSGGARQYRLSASRAKLCSGLASAGLDHARALRHLHGLSQ